MTQTVVLSAFAFLAGLVDSIVGGGGLVQLPALFICLPQAAAATLVGTSKLSSIAGTSVAAVRFARRYPIPWTIAAPSALAALGCSFLGARTMSLIPGAVTRGIVLVLLLGVGIFPFFRKDFGGEGEGEGTRTPGKPALAAGLLGAAIGFYDGFFGAGTGSFLIFGFVGIVGFTFLRASATAKVINVATNLAALVWFIGAGNVLWEIAVPMAISNVAGSWVGSRLAILKGNVFIRRVFLVVVGAMVLKLAWGVAGA